MWVHSLVRETYSKGEDTTEYKNGKHDKRAERKQCGVVRGKREEGRVIKEDSLERAMFKLRSKGA